MVVIDLKERMTELHKKAFAFKEDFKEDSIEEEFDTFVELQSIFQSVKNFMKTFNIGYNVKTFKDEKGATSKLRKILQDFMDSDYAPEGGVGELKQRIKDKVVKYKDGQPNIADYEIERVARTELSSMRSLHKLLKWKEEGFTTVQHNAHLDTKTGTRDKQFNGKKFKIDFLLGNTIDRIPLHPNCRCWYTLWE